MRALLSIPVVLSIAVGVAADGSPQVETFDDETDRRHIKSRFVIQSKTADGRWKKKAAIYPLKGEKVSLKVEPKAGATVRWYMIFADLSRTYKNANHPWEKDAYKWVGIEKIGYHRIELARWRGQWEIEPFAGGVDALWKPVRAWQRDRGAEAYTLDLYNGDAGTFWFQAEIEKDGAITRSPGIEDADTRGISRRVMRVSIRDGEGYLGYLTSFLNVPGVFGSVVYQSANHIGVDCADVLVAARAKWKRRGIDKNYNVQMLVGKHRHVAEVRISEGAPDTEVRWGEGGVRPGDFIAVGYDATRKYHHIGALVRDQNGNGLLDGPDIALHSGPWPLHYTKLSEGAFDGRVVILRP